MAGARAETGELAALTPRQREWLHHLRACSREGGTLRAYAKRHGLSEYGLYEAARVLRQRGVLAPGRPRRSAAKPPTFVKVTPAVSTVSPIGSSPWRVRFPNGVVLEGTDRLGTEWLEALARL
jgi:hypothetical protein